MSCVSNKPKTRKSKKNKITTKIATTSTTINKESKKILSCCKIFSLAESLGGVESLIEHPAIMTHASVPVETRKKLGITDGFIRLSVGIEALDDLKGDLKTAFNLV